ncbi:hypothetical protein HNR19_002132 [Nocardioides thalensis]|uniref:Aminoglycoside phosphotransferase domain-containing protein n=1 Tax=Nocardioides thalensis TaxID=1914755 RepID=A0A853C280_9ACTN|nr:aminoglycoside phosphotransferase family protein [Nocardioides thalensis]NYJ01434.1 hypothetical protein [Nocardioides thalensis]
MIPPARLANDDELVVDRARTAADVRRIRREVEGRLWAASHGIPTAEIVAKDDDDRWLVSRRVLDEPGEPAAYVCAAFEMSARIQALPHPRFLTAATTWRAPRLGLPLRLSRMARAGIDPRDVVAARRAFEELPATATVHNDYHRQNVLNTASVGHVTVIDWEYATIGPRHQDAVRLIVDIADHGAAHEAWRTLVDLALAADRPALATILRWMTIRTYCSEVAVSRRVLDPAKCAHRRERWLQARLWADELARPAGESR